MYYEKGDMEAAVGAYTELINNYPSGMYVIEAYLGRANAYYELNAFTSAQEDFQYVIDHHHLEDQELASKARFGLGWVLVKSGDVTAGVRSFQSVYEQSKDQDIKNNALIQMADAYQEGGRFNDAIGIYEQISKNGQRSGLEDYIQYRLAVALLKAEKFEVAQIAFTTLMNKFPDSKYLEDVNYYQGVIQFKNNNWGKAANFMDVFLKGLTAPSEFSAQANYILALSYLNQKQSEEALKIFQKILRLYPDEPVIAKNSDLAIAKCLFELGQVKEAVKRFKLIVFKYPKSEVEQEALLWLAQEAMKNFQYLQAVEYYRELLDKTVDLGRRNQINYELGQAYEVQGALDEALVQYKLVTSKDATLISKVKLAIAGILSREFDAEKAIKAYLNIAASNTEYAREAYLKVALLYRNAQNYEQEIQIYEKALQVEQGKSMVTHVELLFSIADTYELLGNIEKAVDYYLKVPALYRDQTTWIVKSYLRVAKIYEDRKDWEGAKVTYQKIVQFNVEESKFALDRLELLKKK
jgi:tetratricopeptide (TPR) repeat protein